ncbi:hypothetical protein G4Y79_12955 [Phototrophicus methaneseepsis]|uniref:Uncharacterized protein n=1 Tax=Phototrophicus methaneseepsis TaxID=2710758 RepID=A0A7S8E5B3_9CHLR|nr:hypothetical protein [Phototrophicus methaneseepsis]QPC80620.1 hypothetical protein G4Y79_12955 [Phototrophicus methaneseepsis]
MRLVTYDATAYGDLVTTWDRYTTVTLSGDKDSFAHEYIKVYALTTSQFAYERVRRIGIETCTNALVGAYDTIAAAVEAAQAQAE